MRGYLDPRLYLYSEQEWKSQSFIPRLDALIKLIQDIEELEADGGIPADQGMRFMSCDRLTDQLFTSNPFKNDPTRPFYFQQFSSTILPYILRKSRSCATEACLPIGAIQVVATPTDPSDQRDTAFATQLDQCVSCSRGDQKTLIRFTADECLTNASSIFERVVSLPTEGALSGYDAANLLPLTDGEGASDLLNFAVSAYAATESAGNPTWSKKLTKLVPTDSFWRSLSRADFRGCEETYRRRICRTLSQIALGIDLDIHAHGMTNKTFLYLGRKIGMWNAYVFQMGCTDQDRRCSRIYYGYSHGTVVLHEYEPDAH